MRSRKLALGLLAALAVPTAYIAKLATSDAKSIMFHDPLFELRGRPVGGSRPAAATAAYLTASRIAAVGEGALVIDADSGNLLTTNAKGDKLAELHVGADAGLLTYDPVGKLAYVADRMGDRVVVVGVGTKLSVVRTMKTPVEPYAVALAPDRQTVFVSTIADRTLVAYEAATGKERWRAALGREPRGLAVSPDGSRALVSYLASGAVDQIDLRQTRRTDSIALSTAAGRPRARLMRAEGDAFARASFAVTFMGVHQAVVPFQREVPVQQRDGAERTGSYGGGFDSPITQQMAFIAFDKGAPTQTIAAISQQQARSVAWDSKRDALYIAGMGNDQLMQVKKASQVDIQAGALAALTGHVPTATKQLASARPKRCGADGIAVTDSGDLLVWCSFTRAVHRVETVDDNGQLTASMMVAPGAMVAASRMKPEQHAGMVLFHSNEPAMSARGALACATCHPDNRTDGLSWRIDKQELQTPLLNGRIRNTHPYKWDGGDKDINASLTSTMKRLGGFGLDKTQVAALTAYVENIPAVRTPTRDARAVARGKALFDGEVGCRTCHDGPAYTDQHKHKLTGSLAESDTPSLLGLAASAPYYHDGSAATLEALLRERGAVHGMAETSKLSDAQVADLVAFLETL